MSDNHRLVINFKRKADMKRWAQYFEQFSHTLEIISVEQRSRKEMKA